MAAGCLLKSFPLQLQLDPAMLAADAVHRFDENEHFKQHLKSLPTEQVDKWVMQINSEVEPAIDCLACGKCCNRLMVNIDDAAIDRLSKHLQLTEVQFRDRFVEGGSFMSFLNAIPCQFLDGKACAVYNIRPDDCRNFPQLDRPDFTSRMFGTFRHYGMCPIIYNVVEQLKTTSGFFKD